MDVSCAPTNTNAAKGLVNQLAGGPSAAPFASSSSSTNSAQQLAAQDFFARQAAAARPQYAIPNLLQTAPAPLILAPPHIQQQQQLSHLHSQWAAEFDTPSQHPIRLQQNAHIDFESAFVNARNATFLPAGAGGWNPELMQSRIMQQPYLQTATSNSSIVPLQHTINHDPAFDQEWHAQFDAVDVKGKTPVTAIPQIQQQQNTHVHGDLDSWSQEFDKLDLKETKEFGEWDERFKELDFDLEGAKTEEEREEMMKKMGDLWKELQAEGERAGAGRVESGGVHNPWDGGYEDFLNGAQSVIDPDPVTAPWTEYKFESNNPFLGRIDALEQGLQILASPGGSLSQAALAFEAAVQLNQSNNSDAWMHLGKVQAENEKEDAAIIALHKSVQLNPSNISALMSLAISYTNEARELEAYATLNRWLSTKYPTIPETVAPAEYISKYEIHDASTARFLQAVKINSTSGLIDADLQLGLGVLFYNCQEFDKVIDCFTAALRVRSSDYLLWNRLGATLANSGRSEEAIEAYRKALELKPSFVRCRYNLGVSCINIGCYREAAEHLLGALSLHDVGGDHGGIGHINVSENLWDTLRRTFVQMRRMDLAELTQSDRDVNKFRKEFEF